jgi:hypothetical protein
MLRLQSTDTALAANLFGKSFLPLYSFTSLEPHSRLVYSELFLKKLLPLERSFQGRLSWPI